MANNSWHDPKVMHDILNSCGHAEVHICPGCEKHQKETCPHRGNEPVGICKGYSFAENDRGVYARVYEHTLANASRASAKQTAELRMAAQARTVYEPRMAEKPQLPLFPR